MKIRNIAGGVLIAAVVATTAACGSDDNGGVPPVPTAADTSATSAAADPSGGAGDADDMTNPNKVPSVAALNTMLETALDPEVKPAQKVDLVEGAEADPDLFNQLVQAVEDNPGVKYAIRPPVTKNGPKRAKVKVEVRLPDNPPTKIDAAIVYDGGRWKLAKSTVCPLLTSNDVETPLCDDGGSSASSKKPAKPSKPAKSTES